MGRWVRLPTWQTDRQRTVVCALLWVGSGLGVALGPAQWSSSGSFAVLRDVVPVVAWAWAQVVVGVLILVHQVVGYTVALLLHWFTALLVGLPLFTGQAQGWPAPWLYAGFAALAYFGLVAALRERQPSLYGAMCAALARWRRWRGLDG